MHPDIAYHLAVERQRELHAAARAAALASAARPPRNGRLAAALRRLADRLEPAQPEVSLAASSSGGIVIRRSRAGDHSAVARLARLDSKPVPAGPLLVAEVDGELEAALPVLGGPAVANPFRPTAHLVSLLALRARQLAVLHPARRVHELGHGGQPAAGRA